MKQGYPHEFKVELESEAEKLVAEYTDFELGDEYQASEIFRHNEINYKERRSAFEGSLKSINVLREHVGGLIENEDLAWRFYCDAEQAGISQHGIPIDEGIAALVAKVERHLSGLEQLSDMCARLAQTKEGDTEGEAGVKARGRPKGPAQPLMGALIRRAADAYFRVTGMHPGQSNSRESPFMRFLTHTIERIPEQIRPQQPSLTMVGDVLRDWATRSPNYQQAKY